MCIVQLTLLSVQLTLSCVQLILLNAQLTLPSAQLILPSVQLALTSVQLILLNAQLTLPSAQLTLPSVQLTLASLQCWLICSLNFESLVEIKFLKNIRIEETERAIKLIIFNIILKPTFSARPLACLKFHLSRAKRVVAMSWRDRCPSALKSLQVTEISIVVINIIILYFCFYYYY